MSLLSGETDVTSMIQLLPKLIEGVGLIKYHGDYYLIVGSNTFFLPIVRPKEQ